MPWDSPGKTWTIYATDANLAEVRELRPVHTFFNPTYTVTLLSFLNIAPWSQKHAILSCSPCVYSWRFQWKLDWHHLKANQSGSRFTGNITEKLQPKPNRRMRRRNQDEAECILQKKEYILNSIILNLGPDSFHSNQNILGVNTMCKDKDNKSTFRCHFDSTQKKPQTKSGEIAWLKS